MNNTNNEHKISESENNKNDINICVQKFKGEFPPIPNTDFSFMA